MGNINNTYKEKSRFKEGFNSFFYLKGTVNINSNQPIHTD